MTQTIALSIDRILENIYAYSALDYYTTKNERPTILGRNEAPALRQLIRNSATSLIYRLTPPAIGWNLDDEEIITIDFEIAENFASLRSYLESILAAQVMSVAWAGASTNLSNFYADAVDQDIEVILAKLRFSDKPGRIGAGM